jgi:dTDP-4-dehydrorhamnose reductase
MVADEIIVLVLGGTGMLGHKIFQRVGARIPGTWCMVRGSEKETDVLAPGLLDNGKVIHDIEAANWSALEGLLNQSRPKVIVNCVGIIKQRSEAKDAVSSIEINSLLPHKLAKLCACWGGRLIHFSTDCVFTGKRGHYTENDLSDAEDMYGKTKYLGEVSSEPNAITLRTSIIGRELTQFQSLLEWFLAQNGRSIQGYTRAFYSGVTTNYLADVVAGLIKDFPGLTGLYQVTGQTISKFDLLCLLRTAYELNIEIVPNEDDFCDRSMLGNKFEHATGYQTPPWTELVTQLVEDTSPYKDWRGNALKTV